MDFYKKHFGQRLRSILDERGLNQAELAEMVGVNTSMVSRWVNGHDFPSNENAHFIAQKLGMKFEDLCGSVPESKNLPSIGSDRKTLRLLIEDPAKTPVHVLPRLLEEFQSLSRVRRAAVLATFFDDPRLSQDALIGARHPKIR